MDARTSGMQGDGVLGTRPVRERGIRPATIRCRSSWDVCAAGEFPRSATQSNGRRADGVSVLTGKAGWLAESRRVHDAMGIVIGERTAGTCGRIHPQNEENHTRRTGRIQGECVVGSGHAAVGGSSAGVLPSFPWRSARTEGGAGSPSFPAGLGLQNPGADSGTMGGPANRGGKAERKGITNTRRGNA